MRDTNPFDLKVLKDQPKEYLNIDNLKNKQKKILEIFYQSHNKKESKSSIAD